MSLGFKEFFHAFGKALITAAEEMDKQEQSNDIDNQYNPYQELDSSYNNPEGENSIEIQFQQDNDKNIRGTEYEEFNQPVKRDQNDEEDPDAFEQNSQGENNFQDDFSETDDTDPNQEQDQENTSQDPDRQGNVRYVEGAHLVSRRQVDDGTYEELWIYNIDKNNTTRSDKIIKNILKGTDIPENEISSDDGSQDYVAWTVGNVQMIKVRGLPE